MDIYISVSDNDRHLTLDGDLDLLDRLLATVKSERSTRSRGQIEPTPADRPMPITAQAQGRDHVDHAA